MIPQVLEASRSSTIDLSFLFDNDTSVTHDEPRDFIINSTDGGAMRDANRELTDNPTRVDNFKTAIFGAHVFGQSLAKFDDELGYFGDHMGLLIEGFGLIENVLPFGTGFQWNHVGFAEKYKVYYARESGVTASNYQSLAGGGVHTTSDDQTSILFSSFSGLVDNTQYYFSIAPVLGSKEGVASTNIQIITPGGAL